LVFVLVGAVIWWFTRDFDIVTGIVYGGGLSLINFDVLKRVGRKIVADPKHLKLHYFILIWIKFVMMIALCELTIYYKLVNIPAFFISLSTIVFAIIGATIYSVYQGFTDLVGEDADNHEEKYIGWDDVDNPGKKGYKPTSKKSIFDQF
jgi:hypothetical protein